MTSTDQQYCLRWNNHQSTLMTTFENLLLNETLVDVTLVAEGQSVLAHKVVLSACSPYFESICTRFYDKHPVIVLKDVKHSELKALLDYMYKGELNISQDHLGSLLKTAESLQIKGLAESPDDNVTDKKKQSRRSPERTASPIPKKQKVSSVTVEKSSQPRSLSHGNLRTSERGSSISMTKHIVPSSPGEVPSPATVELDDYYEPSAVPVEPKPDPISEPPQRPSRPSSVSQDMDTSIKHSERNVSQIVKEEVLDDDMPIALDEDSQRFEGNEEDLTLDPGPSTSLDESGEGPSAWGLDSGGDGSFSNFPQGSAHDDWLGNPSMVDASWSAGEGLLSSEVIVEDPRQFHCPNCPKKYMNRRTLARHLKYECGVERQFVCTHCGWKFARKETWKMHEEKHLSNSFKSKKEFV